MENLINYRKVCEMLSCVICGNQDVLIQGFCKQCEPRLHFHHRLGMRVQSTLSKMFEQKTGKKPLDAWYEFETFAANAIQSKPRKMFKLIETQSGPNDGDRSFTLLYTR